MAKTIVKIAFKACLKGQVYPKLYNVGDEVSGEAAEIGADLGCLEDTTASKKAAPKKAAPKKGVSETKVEDAAPENKADGAVGEETTE